MKKIVTIACMIPLLLACSSSPRIIPLANQPGLPPLRKLANGHSQLVIIFVHGIGDHCPGYALGPQRPHEPTPWIDAKMFRELGIRGPSHGTPTRYFTPVFANTDGSAIEIGTYYNDIVRTPLGNLVTQIASLGKLGNVPVTGVEITWSELTFKIKNEILGYDVTKKGRRLSRHSVKTNPAMSCFRPYEYDINTSNSRVLPPPSRAIINRSLKEEVLDQNLSDAILDLGPYRDVIERAVAQGICEAIALTAGPDLHTSGDTAPNLSQQVCWFDALSAYSNTSSRAKNAEYVIITHSLGSRIVYDVVRYLNQIDQYHDSPFPRTSSRIKAFQAFSVFPQFTCHLGAVYMMANQLSLLGMGMGGPLRDVVMRNPAVEMYHQSKEIPGPERPPAIAKAHCEPQFVAFVDPNDLLSWGIMPTMDPTYFHFTTVFVNNSWWHWFGAFEWPNTAHSGYFDNRRVGEVISCGTEDDAIREDCGTSAYNLH